LFALVARADADVVDRVGYAGPTVYLDPSQYSDDLPLTESSPFHWFCPSTGSKFDFLNYYSLIKAQYMAKHLIHHLLFLKQLNQHTASCSAVSQKMLMTQYKLIYHSGINALKLNDVGFRCYSQHEEDGILLFIFSLIGTTNKLCVEICAGDGVECNTANLILNHRWIGLLCDGDARNIKKAKAFYGSHPDAKYWPPTILHHWITRDNVNTLLASHGFQGDIDLLSLDVDGVDYWLWHDLDTISPRVVILEFNHLWGPDACVTVPYADDFVADFTPHGSDYAGASLGAFVKLGKAKGYRFVGTNAIATNAFFIRQDIACAWLPEAQPHDCFNHPRAQFGMRERFRGVRNREWLEV